MKTTRERAEEKREAKLEQVREQVESGSLVIRQMTADEAARPPVADSEQDQVRALEVRVAHLEALVQGLQDSVHRESLRYAKRIGELEARTEPATLGKALSEDARARGL